MANLTFRAVYFKSHNEAWDGFSSELTALRRDFIDAEPAGTALTATFLHGWIDSFKRVRESIQDKLYGQGIVATREVGDKLETSCRLYLQTEAENQAQADRILERVGY